MFTKYLFNHSQLKNTEYDDYITIRRFLFQNFKNRRYILNIPMNVGIINLIIYYLLLSVVMRN